MTDWTTVENSAIAAAKGVLGGAWNAASSGATAQIKQLVQTAQYIESNTGNMNTGNMTADEAKFLMSQQKTALQNVLTIYEAIGIAAAINTVNAVISVIINNVPGIAGFL